MVLSMQTCLHFNSFETSLRPNKMCFATPIGVATHRLGTNALYTTISEQIVPPMAVAEAQGVILFFNYIRVRYNVS